MPNPLTSLKAQYACFLIWLGAAPPKDCCAPPPVVTAGAGNAWYEALQAGLPEEREAVARNREITRTYACWYLQRPHLFKWAGMAAFASHRVGFFLLEAENQNPDVELMRLTNNQVFADVGWAHLAYMQQGLAAVEAVAAGQPDYELMLKGFRLIDEGKTLLQQAGIDPEGPKQPGQTVPPEALELIWRGNLFLLKQEQAVTVQRNFDVFSYNFKQSLDSLTWATTLDFDGNNLNTDPRTRASFEEYERVSRVALDFTKFEDRWAWTVSEALPKWQAVEAEAAGHILQTLVLCGDSSLLIAPVNWLKKEMSHTVAGEIDLFINLTAMFSLGQRLVEMMKQLLTEVLVRWVLLSPRGRK